MSDNAYWWEEREAYIAHCEAVPDDPPDPSEYMDPDPDDPEPF
jgi:hypothetical protein